jgi:hypothetical protein
MRAVFEARKQDFFAAENEAERGWSELPQKGAKKVCWCSSLSKEISLTSTQNNFLLYFPSAMNRKTINASKQASNEDAQTNYGRLSAEFWEFVIIKSVTSSFH